MIKAVEDKENVDPERLVRNVAAKSGLSPEVCLTLLEKGWMYFESATHPPIWKSPGWGLLSRSLNDTPLGHATRVVFYSGKSETLISKGYRTVGNSE